jgi:hypothetical protein
VNWNSWIRQVHRWFSVAFVATVLACFVAVATVEPPEWLFYLPLPPLFGLMFTGIYLFLLPYLARRRGGPRSLVED